jgi:glycosyltransferase involved in cell wall biosynthesis
MTYLCVAIYVNSRDQASRDALRAAEAGADLVEYRVDTFTEPHDLGARYATAWVTCLPTVWDSFGLVVVESLAAGTPVVVGPSGAPPEVVEPAIGVVATSLEPEPLSRALSDGFALAERPPTVAACQRIATQYDWDAAIAPLLEKLYMGTERC